MKAKEYLEQISYYKVMLDIKLEELKEQKETIEGIGGIYVMSNLFNIDLKGHTPEEQINKIEEEETEFDNALIEFRDRKANISETKERELSEHAIEEFWDMIQAYEVQEGYTKHHKKMDKRGYKPRAKESEE